MRYLTMPASPQVDANGDFYPDPFLMNSRDLTAVSEPKPYRMTQSDLDRFDITCATEYGDPNYDDLVLIFNSIETIHDVIIGQILLFPVKADLDAWIARNRV